MRELEFCNTYILITIYLKSTYGKRTHVREQKKGSLVIGRVIVAGTQTPPSSIPSTAKLSSGACDVHMTYT
jgi:hypothetical protein